MISRKTLENASFWEQSICLDCGVVQALAEEADVVGPCDECGSPAVYAASFVLRCADLVEAEE